MGAGEFVRPKWRRGDLAFIPHLMGHIRLRSELLRREGAINRLLECCVSREANDG
jgi:hypothetical protein